MKGKKWISFLFIAILSMSFAGCGFISGLLGGGKCTHQNATKNERIEATCYQTGRMEYWSCDNCGKWFKDEACTQPVDTAELNSLDIPMKEHVFVEDKLHCTSEGCLEEKPRTTELAGHTYIILQNNVDWDYEKATEEQRELLNALSSQQAFSRYTGSKLEFKEGGKVVSTEIDARTDGNTIERVFEDTYVQDGDSFTITRVFNQGTAEEESATETYVLNEYDYWVQSVDISASLVAGYQGAKAVIQLEEMVDHKLRHTENSYSAGVCSYCGEIETPLMDLKGTTWKFTSVEVFYYSDQLAVNQGVETFVQNYFEQMLNVTYTLKADGTVDCSVEDGARNWTQVGNWVSIEIYQGVDEQGNPVYGQLSCKLKEEGILCEYAFTEEEDKTAILEDDSIPAEYKEFFSAIILLKKA